MAGGVIAGVEAGANMVRAWNSGDTGGAISNGVGFVSFLAGAALSGVRMGGKVTPCDWGSQAGAWAQRALYGITTGASLYGAGSRIAEGDYVGGALDLLTTGISMRQMMKACFTGRMLMDVEHGKKRVDRVRVDDLLWTRDENNPAGPVQLKRVLQVFVRVAPILNLHVGGQIIETTAEHPFYVCGRGWILGGMLKKGDLLQTRSGESVPVEGVADSGRVETVYNFEIEDDHTYFVGSLEWGFSVWAHNLSCEVKETKKGPNKGQKTIVITDTK